MEIMRVYITGGSGMVGRNLTDLLENSHIGYFAPSSSEVDLLEYDAIFASLEACKPDLIIHCAGVVGGIAANIAEPYRFCDQNAQMGINLIRASATLGIKKLLNLGSSCMYPVGAMNPLKETSILTGALEPTNEGYALAKIIVARLCDYVSRQDGLKYKTIIPCNLYGKFDHFDLIRSHMIPSAVLKIHNARVNHESDVMIWGDGTARREFMYAGDLADFLLFAIGHYDDLPTSMNVGLGVDYTINKYYAEIAKVAGYRGAFSHDASQPAGVRQKLVNVDAQKSLGWMPSTSLSRGIEQTYQFFLEGVE